jgi:hypothetical protein
MLKRTTVDDKSNVPRVCLSRVSEQQATSQRLTLEYVALGVCNHTRVRVSLMSVDWWS